jgi:hypothetical protein
MNLLGPLFDGDGPPQMRPEIVAAEQRILTMADGMLDWMRKAREYDSTEGDALVKFMVHEGRNPLRGQPHDLDKPVEFSIYFLDRMDRDANRLFIDLMRACFERRCWQKHYGERKDID